MKDSGETTKCTDMVVRSNLTELTMSVNGKTPIGTEEAISISLMILSTRVNGEKTKFTGWES